MKKRRRRIVATETFKIAATSYTLSNRVDMAGVVQSRSHDPRLPAFTNGRQMYSIAAIYLQVGKSRDLSTPRAW